MRNFTGSPLNYRDRVRDCTERAYEEAMDQKLKEGGTFDAIKAVKLFTDCLDFAATMEDLVLASGLRQANDEDEEETQWDERAAKRKERLNNADAIRNQSTGDSEGPSGDTGDVNGLRHPECTADPTCNNGTTGDGEVDLPE